MLPCQQRCAHMGKPLCDAQLKSSRALVEQSKGLASTNRLVSAERRFPELAETDDPDTASGQ
ncbi:hypothetical protein BN77_p2100017 [Rhizobium mesoamericanum STM3625]|uniref:Uncharacterized protein n=1 Tax=Rhizobium mesoamericanum STM3625 TaxID=1211777 RepID=K0Q6H7_9HYPH|nr:hypothetical protein BN77_p2100017 [Rhizobium mesoamericanum STM3625]